MMLVPFSACRAVTALACLLLLAAPAALAGDSDAGTREARTWFVGHNDVVPWTDRSPCVHEPVIDHVGGACFHRRTGEHAVRIRATAGTTGHAVGAAYAFHDTERVLAEGHFCGTTGSPVPVPEGAVMLTVLAHGPARAALYCPTMPDEAPPATAVQGEITTIWQT